MLKGNVNQVVGLKLINMKLSKKTWALISMNIIAVIYNLYFYINEENKGIGKNWLLFCLTLSFISILLILIFHKKFNQALESGNK